MIENPEFTLSQEVMEYTGNHLFLTGKAGTGKTSFLQQFYRTTQKNAVITAPTGVAAINAGGVTLHSMFNLPFQAYIPSLMSVDASLALNTAEIRNHFKFNKNKLKVLRQLEVLIIDEISMVRADTLDAINEALKFARRIDKPFGGVQVLFIGDMYQLPPVVKQEEWNVLSQFYTSPYFFSSKVLQDLNVINVELKHIYRQTDGQFISLLNSIRNNEMDEFQFELLNERYFPEFSNEEKIITLTTHNKQADEINIENLKNIKEPTYSYFAEIEGSFPENAYPLPLKIDLKKGAKVMFIKNDSSLDKRYYNGKIVEVVELNEEDIWVELEKGEPAFKLEKEEWQNKRYAVDEENTVQEEVLGTFRQYPIRLAWAITIHKSQGLTFDKAVINAGKAFAPGQVYVALSRCTQLDGVYLQSQIRTQNLFTDQVIVDFQNNFWNSQAIQEIIEEQKKPYALDHFFKTLDFQPIINEVKSWILYTHKNPSTYQEEISTIQIKIERALKNLQEMRNKFRNIAFQTYEKAPESEEVWNEILDRSKKAIDYFLIDYVTKVLRPFSAHIDDMEKKSRTVTYLKETIPLESIIEAKVPQLKKAKLLGEPLYVEINPIPKIEKPKTDRINKKKTSEITLDLLNEGLSIEDIALERNLGKQTIEKHIIELIQTQKITNIEDYISESQLNEVKTKLPKDYNEMNLKELMEKTKHQFSYFELQLAKLL